MKRSRENSTGVIHDDDNNEFVKKTVIAPPPLMTAADLGDELSGELKVLFEQRYPSTITIFFELIKQLAVSQSNILSLIFRGLDMATLQSLGKNTAIEGLRAKQNNQDISWSPTLVFSLKQEFLNMKAAADLRDHVMHWRYDEAKALATENPYALMIPCQYKNNRWQGDEHIVNESALEHAWRTGDENFIVLFEELGKDLPRSAFTHRDKLLADSQTGRNTLADALNQYANDDDWNALKPIWLNAPHWVFGLDYLIWDKNLEDAAKIDIFSPDFRSACPGGRPPYLSLWQHGAALARHLSCLSVKVSTAQRSTEQRPMIFNV